MKFSPISKRTDEVLRANGLDPREICHLIELGITEDLAGGEDVTSVSTISSDHKSRAVYRNRRSGVVAGIPVAVATLEMLGLQEITYSNEAGERAAGSFLIEVAGNTRAILLAERTSLNFLGHLSGIATLTHSWVKEVTGTHCKIRDTRKTTPGYRALEKYAVRMGGGTNHRMSLSDAALIKDNHISASGDIVAALNAVRSNHPKLDMEIEVDSLDQLEQVLSLKPQLVLLDNMPAALCAQAVKLVAGAFQLEASGGIALAQAAEFAQTGIDYIAVGALTHSAPVLDIGLDFIESTEEK